MCPPPRTKFSALFQYQTTVVSDSKSRKHADMDHEIRRVISTLADRLMGLGKEGGDGTGIVVLAGENEGAVTKANLQEMAGTHGVMHADEAAMEACVNNNYQAVNNSIVLGGSCTAEDPGVHIYIHEDDDGEDEHMRNGKVEEE